MAKNKKPKNGSSAARRHLVNRNVAQLEMGINQRINTALHTGINIGFARALAIMLWVMHDSYGWGKVRTIRFMRTVHLFTEEHILTSTRKQKRGTYQGMDITDICEQLADELGVLIDENTGTIQLDDSLFSYYRYGEEVKGNDE